MVKRYDIDCHVVELYEQPYGEAVMYEDYEKLREAAKNLLDVADYVSFYIDTEDAHILEEMREVLKNG